MKPLPPLRLTVLLLALALPAARAAAAIDVAAAPRPADVQRLLDGDWLQACTDLRAALTSAYTPQACGSDAFAAWLDLHRWFDAVARNEFDETARLTSQHMRWQSRDRRIVVFPPGAPPGGAAQGLAPLSNTMAQQVVRDPRFAETALPALAPAGFRPADRKIGDGISRERLALLMGDADLGRELFQNLHEADFLPAVVGTLARLQEAGGAQFPAYRRLAVALALVHDQPAPPQWPHNQVTAAAVPRAARSPVQRFSFWIQCQEEGRLYLDLRALEVEQLKFVVDAPVHESELFWAQDHVKLARYRFAEAFDLVRYVQARIKQQQFTWPGRDYSLRAIQAAGGICVDQAYFAMLAGKAKGLPTLFFSGQGPGGGHAWFGFMKRDDTWVLDCGRERNRGHPVGTALDPQTWNPISDHQLEFLASGFRDKPPYQVSLRHMAAASLFGQLSDRSRQNDALRNAIAACPPNASAWEALTTLLTADSERSATPKALAALRAHAESAIQQFETVSDLRVRYQRLLADLARKQGDAATAEQITQAIIRENRGQRSDLSVQAAWQRLKGLMDQEKTQEAYTQYLESSERLGRSAGGNFYFQLVVPFVQALLECRERTLAEEALAIARKVLRPPPLSPLDTHMAKLQHHIRQGGEG